MIVKAIFVISPEFTIFATMISLSAFVLFVEMFLEICELLAQSAVSVCVCVEVKILVRPILMGPTVDVVGLG